MIEIKTKVCGKCKVEKDESDFSKGKSSDGLYCWCKACQSEYNRNRYEKEKAEYADVNVYDGGERTCTQCLGVFPKEKKYWSQSSIGTGGLQSHCRVCLSRRSSGYKDSGNLADDIVSRVLKKWSRERLQKRNKKENATP